MNKLFIFILIFVVILIIVTVNKNNEQCKVMKDTYSKCVPTGMYVKIKPTRNHNTYYSEVLDCSTKSK